MLSSFGLFLVSVTHTLRPWLRCSFREDAGAMMKLHIHMSLLHCSVLAWRIPGTGEPGGLPSMGSRTVGHDRCDLAAAAAAGKGRKDQRRETGGGRQGEMPTELSWYPPDSFVVSATWPFDLGPGHHDHLDPILLDSGVLIAGSFPGLGRGLCSDLPGFYFFLANPPGWDPGSLSAGRTHRRSTHSVLRHSWVGILTLPFA